MSKEIRSYIDLEVWLEARKLTGEIYSMSKKFSKEERYGLTNQIRKASISIPSNIAEGCGRSSPKDSMHFFYIARGSLYELETQQYISYDLNYIDDPSLLSSKETSERVYKVLSNIIKTAL